MEETRPALPVPKTLEVTPLKRTATHLLAALLGAALATGSVAMASSGSQAPATHADVVRVDNHVKWLQHEVYSLCLQAQSTPPTALCDPPQR